MIKNILQTMWLLASIACSVKIIMALNAKNYQAAILFAVMDCAVLLIFFGTAILSALKED